MVLTRVIRGGIVITTPVPDQPYSMISTLKQILADNTFRISVGAIVYMDGRIEGNELIVTERIPFRINLDTFKVTPFVKIGPKTILMSKSFFFGPIHILIRSDEESVLISLEFDSENNVFTKMNWVQSQFKKTINNKKFNINYHHKLQLIKVSCDDHKDLFSINGSYEDIFNMSGRLAKTISMI